MLFSPLVLEDVDQELFLVGAVATAVYLSKTDRGMRLLQTIVKEYFGAITSLTSSMAKGGSTHVLSAFTSQMITVRMMRRLGLLSQAEANAVHHELVWAINKVAIPSILESITGVGTMVFGGITKAVTAAQAPAVAALTK